MLKNTSFKQKLNNRNVNEVELKKVVEETLDQFIRKEKYLLEKNLNERTISHKFAEHLQRKFAEWDVDVEYNKKKDDIKRMRLKGKLRRVFPDIIIHKRGPENNLLIIEIKKNASDEQKRDQIKRINKFKEQMGYSYGLFINFKTGMNFEIKEKIWV